MTMVVMSSRWRRALGTHHARLGRDLQGAIDLEIATCDDGLAFGNSMPHDVLIARSAAQQYFTTFEGWLFCIRQFDVDHRPLAGD